MTEAGIVRRDYYEALAEQIEEGGLPVSREVCREIAPIIASALRLASRHERQSRALVEAREALATARVHVNSQSVAEHMMDGFGPRKPRESDANLDAVDAALARIDAALQEGQK